MLPALQDNLTHLLKDVVSEVAPQADIHIRLEKPKQAGHGDLATNIAMQMAKPLGQKPRDLAQQLVEKILAHQGADIFETVEVAGPGFINFRFKSSVHQEVLNTIFEMGSQYAYAPSNGRKLMVEFVSANPTGPLHVGHARQAALGDCLCRLYSANGYQVHREFYYNDAGNQIDNLVYSVQARAKGIEPTDPNYPADGYRGEYIADIAKAFLEKQSVKADDIEVQATGDINDVEAVRAFSVAYLRAEQDLDLRAFNLKFDEFYLESSLYTDGKVDSVVERLKNSGYTFEKDGALWLKTTELGTGDDKDRVMRKSSGGYTYFLPDVAYHETKWDRGYHEAIDVQGSDHHGTVARVKAGLQALNKGIPVSFPQYVLHKMVRVMRGGKEVKISKRAGSYVTMRDLIDWVGQDAVRFFLIQRKADTEFTFDVDLALSKSEENPVYYIQYAHARICKILRDAQVSREELSKADLSLLSAESEIRLMKKLSELPQLIQAACKELAPHYIAFWLLECAGDFHAWYNDQRVFVEDESTKLARLRLADATRQVLVNALNLLGVSAPESM